jgi:hypothetical protein
MKFSDCFFSNLDCFHRIHFVPFAGFSWLWGLEICFSGHVSLCCCQLVVSSLSSLLIYVCIYILEPDSFFTPRYFDKLLLQEAEVLLVEGYDPIKTDMSSSMLQAGPLSALCCDALTHTQPSKTAPRPVCSLHFAQAGAGVTYDVALKDADFATPRPAHMRQWRTGDDTSRSRASDGACGVTCSVVLVWRAVVLWFS